MNKISFIIEFDEVSKTQEEKLVEFMEKTGIKFQVLESDNDLKKYKKYKDNWNKIEQIIENERMSHWAPSPLFLTELLSKMEELESSDSNE